jgi:hypothetical protein
MNPPLLTQTRQSRLIITLLTFLLLSLTACNLIENNEPAQCDDGGTLFTDEFVSNVNCGWVLYEETNGTGVEIQDGLLQMSSSQPGQFWWTNPGRNFADTIITTTARQASGPNNNAYGVQCRYQSPQNFYIFLISGDGYYAIGKFQTGSDQIQYLTGGGQFQYAEAINQGVATNTIRATCVGNELSLAVNGILLDTVVDPTFVTGDIGLGVTTFDPGTAVVQFENISVIQP